MMGNTEANHSKKVTEKNHLSSKGTFFSVGVVGAVILATYLVIYGLYMIRV